MDIDGTVRETSLAISSPSPDRNVSELSFPPISWPSSANDYQRLVSIGKGKFSEVWSGVCRANANKVAIKIMDLERMSSTFEDILQEVQIMRLCDDVNILSCFCSFVHEDQLWMISQLMDKGSCLRILAVAKQLGVAEGFNEECAGYILGESMKGLNYLHERGHVHRDIKCGNILIDSAANVKLSDFGVSGWIIGSGQQTNQRQISTNSLLHMAPEALEDPYNFDNRADIWSMGITALELVKASLPYPDSITDISSLKNQLEEDPPSLKSYCSSEKQCSVSKFFEDFYRKCLQKNPKLRPSSAELMKHKLLRGRSREPLLLLLTMIPSLEDLSSDEAEPEYDHLPEQLSECFSGARESEDSCGFAPGTSWVFERVLDIPNLDKNSNLNNRIDS